MSVLTPEEQERPVSDSEAIELAVARMERGLEAQERSIRRAVGSFTIFAVLSVLLSLGMLIAVATKLQSKPDTVASVASGAKAAPVAAAPAAALPAKVGISLSEFKIAPTSTKAATGKVTFAVRNTGSVPHEFVVLRTDKPAGSLLKGSRADESGNVGETGDLAPGASKTLRLDLKAGHYAFICNLPGHYKAGQHIDFTVR